MSVKKFKMPRKSTHIDMTAMCDFTLLLLTFFIMATSFKPEEAVEVVTPASTSTKEIPDGFILLTLDKDGRVFFGVDNMNAKRAIVDQLDQDKNLGLTEHEKNVFVSTGSIGVPFSQLKSFLALPESQRSDYNKNSAAGVPVDTTGSFETNELAYWVRLSRYNLDQGGRIAIKADGSSGYPDISKIISTLGKQKIFNFSFITDMKGVPEGTSLFEAINAPQTQSGGE